MKLLQSSDKSATTTAITGGPDSNVFYNKYSLLSSDQKDEVLSILDDEKRRVFQEDYDTLNNPDKTVQQKNIARTNINNILEKYGKGRTSFFGGKRRGSKRRGSKRRGSKRRGSKRRGSKRRGNKSKRRTKKSYKGGYVYSTSKELDKASSLISASSNSSTKSKKENLKKREFTRKNKS
jgi:hypothetical protein